MFRPKPTAARSNTGTGPIKLPQLWAIPSVENVTNIMQMAQKTKNRLVEQYWTLEGQDRLLMLSCIDDETGDPNWSLSAGTLTETKMLWQHRTTDTGLIHSLIYSESSGEVSLTAVSAEETSKLPQSISLGLSVSDDGQDENYENKNQTSSKTNVKKTDEFAADGKEAILAGDIAKIQLANVLQSIQMGKMTGRLAVRAEGRGVDVYFDDGEPLHASDGVDVGDEVILDMIQLSIGKFKFIPDERTVDRTIKMRLDQLLMEAITLVDQNAFLDKEGGLTHESYLINRNPAITLEEFNATIAKGNPVDERLQREIFRAIGEFKSLSDLLRMKPLKRSQWVPIIFNLYTLNLLGISDTPPQGGRRAGPIVEEMVDMKTLETALKPILRIETGILTYPVLQYFLALECYRFELCGMPLSLAVFSMKRKSNGETPDTATIREVISVIDANKRPIDMLGHYQMFDFAVLLPNTGTRSAAVFTQKIHEAVAAHTFASGIPAGDIMMCFGIAGLPENCKNMGQLLSASGEAKKHAETSASPVILYQNIHS